LVLAVAMVSAAFVASREAAAQGDQPSWIAFRSATELLSFRALLRSGAWADLHKLAEKSALWKVTTTSEAAPDGSACLAEPDSQDPPQIIHHQFEFAERRRISSRVYRVEYTTCKIGESQYETKLLRQGFGSDFHVDPTPLAAGATPLNVLRLAMENDAISKDIAKALGSKNIAYLHVRQDEDLQEPNVFRFTVADGVPGDPQTTLVLEYRAIYDPVDDAADFEPFLPLGLKKE
jgi:hypothetical protein